VRKSRVNEFILQAIRLMGGKVSPSIADELLARAVIETNGLPSSVFLSDSFIEAVRNSVEALEPRLAKVVKLRFGIEDQRVKTFEEVGRYMGISEERARQLLQQALQQLLFFLTQKGRWLF